MLSIILPTKSRALQAYNTASQLYETLHGNDFEIIIVAYDEPGNHERLAPLTNHHNIHVAYSNLRAIDAWNYGASLAKGDYLHGSADDLYYHPGWYDAVKTAFTGAERPDSYCRIQCQYNCYWAETGVGHRSFFVNHMNGCIVVPHYNAIYTDVEISDRAINAGVFIHAHGAQIDHRWNGPHPDDQNQADMRTYESRKAQNFPNDFEPVIHA